jgi:hypothetical protein
MFKNFFYDFALLQGSGKSLPETCFQRTSSIAFPLPKQIEACFRTTVFPAKIAGTANLNTCQKGKFQGITPRITPLGA